MQDFESDRIKNHLVILARRLNKAVTLIHPEPAADKGKGKARSVAELSERILKEHKLALVRKVIIERRKEDAERSALEQVSEALLCLRGKDDDSLSYSDCLD